MIHVTKRNGELERLNFEKIHKVLEFSCRELTGVSPSDIAMSSKLQFTEAIKTDDIHKILIRTAGEMICVENPNYQYVAARLLNYRLRKSAFNKYDPDPLYDVVVRNTNSGHYDKSILEFYTEDEINELDKYINHENDENFTYVGMKQFESKFVLKNKLTNQYLESIQQAYMLVCMMYYAQEERSKRMKLVKEYYKILSCGTKATNSIATPQLAGIRTPTRQFASCCVIKSGDSLESINASNNAIVNYLAKRAGVGIDVSEIRPVDSPVRGGEVLHTGLIPFIKLVEASTKSVSQGGLRSASSCLYYPIWHKEIESLIVLKNNKGTPDTRATKIDYCIQMNGHFLKKVLNKERYYLFNQNQHKDLYQAFFNDQTYYEELYNKMVNDPSIEKTELDTLSFVSAMDIFITTLHERTNTSRIYFMFVDNVNNQSSFLSPIYSSNLCTEITEPTANLTKYSNFTCKELKEMGIDYDLEMNEFRNKFGEIAMCILAGINIGGVKQPEDLEKPIYHAVRSLDNMIDYQEYYTVASEVPTKKRRQLGIGINNLATLLAKLGIRYGEGLEIVDLFMEHFYYYAVKASVELAKERGACEWYKDTIYAQGKFIFELRNANVDTIVKHQLRLPWEELRQDMIKYGIRNSCLLAMFPGETSSQMGNFSNGVEPIRKFEVVKGDKINVAKQLFNTKYKYDIAWNIKTEDYLKTMAVIQKWTDQAISSNTYINPDDEYSSKLSTIFKDIMFAYKHGIKTLYYSNMKPDDNDVETNADDCESCKL